MKSRASKLMTLAATTALTTALVGFSAPSDAISINGTFDAFNLANTLFAGSGLNITAATLTHGDLGYGGYGASVLPTDHQSGTYTNGVGTYGLPGPGIVLSSGWVRDYETGPNTSGSHTGGDGLVASGPQNDLLDDLTGQSQHFDPVQLDIWFDVGTETDGVSFIGVFGSEEYPEFQQTSFTDGFGLFLNGTNIAGVLPTGGLPGDPLLPVNIDHPDMAPIPGTELDGVLAPNGIPLLRFDAAVTPGSTGNMFSIIVADASDSAWDTTVYLANFGDFDQNNGGTEFTPLLPSNPPDLETGEFVFDLPPIEPGETIWIDPPVSVGFVYTVTGAEFATITAPSLLTVNDPDGYIIIVNGVETTLTAGAIFTFGTGITEFTLLGIDPALMLDPGDPLAFALGVSFANISQIIPITVGMTPITENTDVVPLPSALLLYGSGLLFGGAIAWRRRRQRVA